MLFPTLLYGLPEVYRRKQISYRFILLVSASKEGFVRMCHDSSDGHRGDGAYVLIYGGDCVYFPSVFIVHAFLCFLFPTSGYTTYYTSILTGSWDRGAGFFPPPPASVRRGGRGRGRNSTLSTCASMRARGQVRGSRDLDERTAKEGRSPGAPRSRTERFHSAAGPV